MPPFLTAKNVKPFYSQSNRTEITFLGGQHVVAVAKSSRYLTAAVAAVPVDYLSSRTKEAARRLVPAGVVAGLVLATSVLLLARMQLSIPSAIRAGLKRREFFLLYQPIVDLQTGEVVGAEALIRWQRSEGELVGPEMFIPIVEKDELILELTRRVFELVAHDTGDFLKRHPGFHIAVNLPAADLHSPQLAATLDPCLQRLAPRRATWSSK
ncbi:EAL domain-containing protein [Massilia cavernae]|uniref:EAL domain-containing protein n=1 Tax=Massilia cavernae TaxID=2320864 RepID=A0A418XQD3_9BURK|nr:EAL domain-containing protein [Massilia cavernae]